jgi:hypothetical protein
VVYLLKSSSLCRSKEKNHCCVCAYLSCDDLVRFHIVILKGSARCRHRLFPLLDVSLEPSLELSQLHDKFDVYRFFMVIQTYHSVSSRVWLVWNHRIESYQVWSVSLLMCSHLAAMLPTWNASCVGRPGFFQLSCAIFGPILSNFKMCLCGYFICVGTWVVERIVFKWAFQSYISCLS